ncbi:MAG TPA: choice-of-anchor R domain-containing protein [Verrucomicrobiae bacterium]|nr:choice-of-anchor R domain-containing protein [Verrucomicrobiae bacterium]
MKPVRLFLGILLTITASLAPADVIVDNLNENSIAGYFGPIGNDSNTNDFLIGQEFTLPGGTNLYQLDEVSLLLAPTNSGGNITVSIWNTSRANTPLTQIAALAPVLITNAGKANFVLSSTVTLSPGTYYVVASPTTPADNGQVWWAYASDTNWTGSGTLEGYADTGSGGWISYPITNLPQQLSVIATPLSSPALAAHRQASSLRLSWASDLTGYELDTTTNLTVSAWQAVTNLPLALGGTNTVTNSLTGPMRFYRLRQDFVVSNLSQTVGSYDGPIGTGTNVNSYLLADEWTVPSGNFTVGKVVLSLNPAAGSAHITASIWNAGPANTPGSQLDIIATQLVTTAGNFSFVPPAPITLSAGNYFVVARAATPSDSGKVGWNWTYSSSWTGFGMLDGYAGATNGIWKTESVADGPYLISIQSSPP